ncbi:glycosyltransferase family 4 protein [Winogradskyella echinorum]|uniref:Glycosyltransferase family 4 protein n=1 Tax=Winogradskyella echinorum TaxID=538189 RepID=A0ABR6XYJ7_9FLAO|nr:glycosyltransferase family 4 protein [Winogradskyella echinorum]MBC3845572.1 glycosyltransferase family 4 protein [Winogradskyella echinorum]MBC5749920.1 glycosyltransferase family 4 protein [Winogradskyella echinorum]
MKSKITHIVFLTPGFAESKTDSTTIPALQVYLKSLKATLPNTKMSLLAFQFPFSNNTYHWNGIDVIPLNGKNKHLKKLLIWRKAMRTLLKLHIENPITVIHSFWIGECSLIGSKFSKKHNIKHISTVMGQDANLGNKYVKALMKTNVEIVTLSENHKATLFNNYKLQSKIIPWELDTTSFPVIQESTIDILGVGSLNEVKNYSLFVKIIADLAKTNPNLKVEIIGEGTMRAALEKQIETLELNAIINLTGKLPRQDVLKKMAQAKVLLHTSTYESFGFVFLEALHSGLQVVSFNVGIAEPLPEWKICTSNKEMLGTLKSFFNEPINDKKRVYLTEKNNCIQSYLKLYNE